MAALDLGDDPLGASDQEAVVGELVERHVELLLLRHVALLPPRDVGLVLVDQVLATLPPGPLVVLGHVELGHARELRRERLAGLGKGGLVNVQLAPEGREARVRRHDPSVRHAGGAPDRIVVSRADPDRRMRLLHRQQAEPDVPVLEMLPREVHDLLGPEAAH
jgi:hypothetical protein